MKKILVVLSLICFVAVNVSNAQTAAPVKKEASASSATAKDAPPACCHGNASKACCKNGDMKACSHADKAKADASAPKAEAKSK